MPDRPIRSRARISKPQNRNRPNAKRLPVIGAVGAIALLAVAGAIIILTRPSSIPLLGHGTPAPNHTLTGSVSETHESSSDMPLNTVGLMDTAMPSESPAPGDTPAASPMDSAPQSDSASPEPDATQTQDGSVDTSTSASIVIKPVTGKADVESYLSLRSDATASSSVVAEIPKDSVFTILQVDKNPAWLEVDYKGKYGYVPVKYVIVEGNPSNQVCSIISMSVNVRHGAGKDEELVAELYNGDTVVVKGQKTTADGTWYKIVVGDLIGYVNSQYCSLASNE